jgi:hypothetical protein
MPRQSGPLRQPGGSIDGKRAKQKWSHNDMDAVNVKQMLELLPDLKSAGYRQTSTWRDDLAVAKNNRKQTLESSEKIVPLYLNWVEHLKATEAVLMATAPKNLEWLPNDDFEVAEFISYDGSMYHHHSIRNRDGTHEPFHASFSVFRVNGRFLASFDSVSILAMERDYRWELDQAGYRFWTVFESFRKEAGHNNIKELIKRSSSPVKRIAKNTLRAKFRNLQKTEIYEIEEGISFVAYWAQLGRLQKPMSKIFASVSSEVAYLYIWESGWYHRVKVY